MTTKTFPKIGQKRKTLLSNPKAYLYIKKKNTVRIEIYKMMIPKSPI